MNKRFLVRRLSRERLDEVVETLCSAFRDYPAMRFIVGDAGDDYDVRLAQLVEYFTDSRLSRGWPVLGIEEKGALVAAANVTPPRSEEPPPPELVERFEHLAALLGEEAISRFHRFAEACNALEPDEPHYYLGMIGVRPAYQGRGLARLVMDTVHEISRRDPESHGVALSTETAENLELYRHFGYRVLGSRDVDELRTWTLFRPDADRSPFHGK